MICAGDEASALFIRRSVRARGDAEAMAVIEAAWAGYDEAVNAPRDDLSPEDDRRRPVHHKRVCPDDWDDYVDGVDGTATG